MKDYTNEEIDALIADVQEQFLAPLFKAAEAEVLAKAEGKLLPTAKEGGNGTEPKAASMAKEESPMAKEASDEKPPEAAPANDAPPAAPAEAAPEMSAGSEGSSSSGSSSSGSSSSGSSSGSEGSLDSSDEQTLEQAYGALDDETLKAHYEALKCVIMQRAQPAAAPGAAPAADPMAAGAPPPAAAPAPAAAPDMSSAPPPAAAPMATDKMAPAMDKAPMMAMKSETESGESLAKTELDGLKKQVEGLTGLLEKMLAKPERKAVTSMAEFLAKSDAEKPAVKQVTPAEVRAKLSRLAKSSETKSQDRDLINRYFLQGDVKFDEIEHLIK